MPTQAACVPTFAKTKTAKVGQPPATAPSPIYQRSRLRLSLLPFGACHRKSFEEDGMKSPCVVNLRNAATVSQRRLGRRVAQLSAARMNEVCAALRFSLGCDSNSLLGTSRLSPSF